MKLIENSTVSWYNDPGVFQRGNDKSRYTAIIRICLYASSDAFEPFLVLDDPVTDHQQSSSFVRNWYPKNAKIEPSEGGPVVGPFVVTPEVLSKTE
jgi:hypothetical protein